MLAVALNQPLYIHVCASRYRSKHEMTFLNVKRSLCSSFTVSGPTPKHCKYTQHSTNANWIASLHGRTWKPIEFESCSIYDILYTKKTKLNRWNEMHSKRNGKKKKPSIALALIFSPYLRQQNVQRDSSWARKSPCQSLSIKFNNYSTFKCIKFAITSKYY